MEKESKKKMKEEKTMPRCRRGMSEKKKKKNIFF